MESLNGWQTPESQHSEPLINDRVSDNSRHDPYADARALVQRLRGGDATVQRPRTRVGAVLLARKYLQDESDLAVRLHADQVSLAQRVWDTLPAGTHWVPLSAPILMQQLDALAEALPQVGQGDCWLVTHLDILLAKLDARERETFWIQARTNLPQRPRALILAFPASAIALLPSAEEWKLWQNDGRAVSIS